MRGAGKDERGGARGLLALLTALAAVGLSAAPAAALTVNSLAIVGSNDNAGVDSRIPASVREALKTFPYDSYRLAGQASRSAALNQEVTLPLHGPFTLKVTPLKATGSGDGRRIELQVRIVKGAERILDLTVALRPGRWCLLGGPSANGGVLIVALAVTE